MTGTHFESNLLAALTVAVPLDLDHLKALRGETVWAQVEDWRQAFYVAEVGDGERVVPWAEEMVAGPTPGTRLRHARIGLSTLAGMLAGLAWTSVAGVEFAGRHWCRHHVLGIAAPQDPIEAGCWEPASCAERAEIAAWREWLDEQGLPDWARQPMCHVTSTLAGVDDHTDRCPKVTFSREARPATPRRASRLEDLDPGMLGDVVVALETLGRALTQGVSVSLEDVHAAATRLGYGLLYAHLTHDGRPALVRVDEIAGIYEHLLAHVPTRRDGYALQPQATTERKTGGVYYTPASLVDLVLDEALDPILDAAEDEAGLLAQTVCDPSCGAGAFIVRAARRIAWRVAIARDDTTPTGVALALHDVVTSCIYGVDLSPVAVEIAKVALWRESVVPGLALPLLSPHVKVGNSVLGTTPALLEKGIPDAAFTALVGDDPKIAAALRKRNAVERDRQATQSDLFGDVADL